MDLPLLGSKLYYNRYAITEEVVLAILDSQGLSVMVVSIKLVIVN